MSKNCKTRKNYSYMYYEENMDQTQFTILDLKLSLLSAKQTKHLKEDKKNHTTNTYIHMKFKILPQP